MSQPALTGDSAMATQSVPSLLTRPADRTAGLLRWMMPVLIVGATAAVFWPATRGEFLSYDDTRFITRNHALIGWSGEHFEAMFTGTPRGYCEPLTWLSYTFDLYAWGLSPRGVHATNLALHALTALLVYALALRLGRLARGSNARTPASYIAATSAALLFAIHPLRAEPVCWASARAYPLAGAFALLSTLCYLRSIEPTHIGSSRRAWLGAALLCYGASLLSAPLAIALPFIFLLLDAYPLRRIGGPPLERRGPRGVLIEKVPFLLVLGLLLALMPVIGLQFDSYNSQFSAGTRLARAVWSVAFGMVKTIWPSGLSPLYELRPGQEAGAAAYVTCAAVLAVITMAALMLRRRVPAVTTAWFSYLLLAAPLSGLVHYGTQLAADRYTYLPAIAAALLAGAAVSLIAGRSTRARIRGASAVAGLGVLLALSTIARTETHYWRSSQTLLRHALAVNPQSHSALRLLAHDCSLQGRNQEAASLYTRALLIAPEDFLTLRRFADLQTRVGELIAAAELYERALKLGENPDVQRDLALVLARAGLLDRAVAAALPLLPPQAREGDALNALDVELGPHHKARLGVLLRAHHIAPEDAKTMNNLAWLRATSPYPEVRDARQAIELAERAVKDDRNIVYCDTLAAAYAEAGEFNKAIAAQREVVAKAETAEVRDTSYRSHLESFKQHRPIREPETIPATEATDTPAR
jgi:protein O-mannosyl-transferase